MNGIVQSGGSTVKTIANAIVTLYEAVYGSPSEIAQATTNGDGTFVIDGGSPEPEGLFYVTADLGDGVLFMANLGSSLPDSIIVNELTTVAAAYSGAQFLVDGALQGDAFELGLVAGMNANLVDVTTGASSSVMTTTPNGDETNGCRTTLSLANVLAACVWDRGKALEILFKATTPADVTASPDDVPTDTITALGNLARNPAHNAGSIHMLSTLSTAYADALREQPVAWTVVVKVNDSGDVTQMFGGPGSIAFDDQGRAWIPNNVVQGEPYSSPYSFVLDGTGRPAIGAHGKKISPYSGGGLLGAGFGVDVDRDGFVWISDFGWGGEDYFPPGSFSRFGPNAEPLSPEDGYGVGVVSRVQGVAVDHENNVWVAGWGNGVVACYRNGDGRSIPATYVGSREFKPFGIAIAKDGTAWVTNSNSNRSSVLHLRLTGTTALERISETWIGKTAKGIVIDSAYNVWVASGGDDHVYVLDEQGTVTGGYQGGGTYGPWGIALDGADNLWVGNFGPLEPGNVFHGRLTCLAGVNAPHHRLGDGLTPPSGYRLTTAGSQVLLADKTPLYGANGPECYIPMMRTTGLAVDAAGNVWTCNNWKPDFNNDVLGNPGGDGILIWVGVAAPKRRKFGDGV